MKTRINTLMTIVLLVTSMSCAALSKLGQAGFKKPTMRFKELILRDLSFDSVTMDFRFELNNPNPVGVRLAGLTYQLDLQGSQFAAGETEKAIEMAAKGSTEIDLPLTVDFRELADSLVGLLKAEDAIAYALQASFAINTPIGMINAPVETAGDFPLPKLPKVRVARVGLDDVSILGATLNFSIEIENRSEVPIEFKKLSYGLDVSGSRIGSGTSVPGALEPGGKVPVNVPVELSFLNLGASIVKVIKSRSLPYVFSGELDLGIFTQPFELEGTAEL